MKKLFFVVKRARLKFAFFYINYAQFAPEGSVNWNNTLDNEGGRK